MNPSTACATVLVDELVRCGVRDLVLSPGSRSAPLAYAALDAESVGRLRLHVRVDERSAGFLALGLAVASGAPVAVATTSGTAVANLHPAVLEAHHAGVPLVVVTADRPAELRGTGANQTTVQPGIFGGSVRWSADLAAGEHRAGQNAPWRSTVCRAVAAATGAPAAGAGPAGPVQLNVGFRDPLLPEPADATDPGGSDWPEPLDGRPGGAPWVAWPPAAGPWPGDSDARIARIEHVERTLVVLGDVGGPARARTAARWAARRGYPLVAEPLGSLDARALALPHGPLALTAGDWLDAHAPDRVLVVGRVTLARPVAALLRRPGQRVEAVLAGAPWPDPSHVVARLHPWSALATDAAGPADPDLADPDPAEPARTSAQRPDWVAGWERAGARLVDATTGAGLPWPSGLAVAGTLAGALPDDALLVLGSSNPIRDLDLALGRPTARGVDIVANRGLAGIDGVVSTAVGAALAQPRRPAYALLGDLTLLHDANGLTIGPGEVRPDLTLVVVNDDGGGIFATLEHGEPGRAAADRVVGTPTGTDLAALCAAHGVAHELLATRAALAAAVAARPDGIRVLEVRVDRSGHRAAHAALRELAVNALAPGSP